ncbi:MAG: FliM/FliN family flagellar motor switch protein [Desulfobacteraceae bacterium]|nr:FliM/FliN family flagellar motor switch protein [Desulfobacteraceae bacterium]
MERILNQEEIDELLSAFDDGDIDAGLQSGNQKSSSSGGAEGKKVSSIDLIRGQNYSKWRIANLDVIFNSFARYYSIALSNSLQQGVTISKGDVVSRFFEDLLVEQKQAGVPGVVSLDPLKGSGLLVFDRNLCFGLVEVLFGMSGATDFVVLDRDVSAIEINIIKSLMSEGCRVFNRAFRPMGELNSAISRVETNWRLINILAPETEVIEVDFSVQVGSLKGNIMLVIPYFSLEPFKDRLRDEGFQFSEEGKKGGNWSKHLENELGKMEMSVSAVWGELFLTIDEILSLNKGDIISFDYEETSPIKVMAGEKTKYSAKPGVRNGKKVVRLAKQESVGD